MTSKEFIAQKEKEWNANGIALVAIGSRQSTSSALEPFLDEYAKDQVTRALTSFSEKVKNSDVFGVDMGWESERNQALKTLDDLLAQTLQELEGKE